ncbi:cytochrome bc1 complex cytochrome b subunit [Rhabdothermincola sp.]|uniref:cytochrome bc1 complex cytochrome b subunit n=1 Tax=Rhabdothermincola sp. TaxID=2820405 RepID=UPI002FDF5261
MSRREHPSPRNRVGRLARWVDDRVGVARAARGTLQKVFPNHWSFLLGEIALYSFVVLVITGVFLTFFFKASTEPVVYEGSYAPLRGVEVSQAYKSTLDLSFDVRAGLVMRQMHHWAALVFVAAIVVHLARVFFTGAFRRPRELNWVIGITLLLLGILNGFAGYSLPDDQLSGTGVRIAYSVLLSVPFIGPWAASLLFGGGFPGEDIIPRLFAIHILIVPVIITGLLTLHLGLLVRHKHTHFPGKGAREDNVVGERLWPTYAFKAGGLFFLVGAVLAALGGLAQINPVWMWGPYQPQNVSSASQPDWYMGWLEGALRLMPNWEWRGWGYQIPNPFWAAVLLPGVTFTLLYLWPWIEARVTKDRREHHVLDRPRDRPVRTALGAATLSFYTVLGFAGSNDVLAIAFDLSLNAVLVAFRVLLFVVPPVVGVVTYRVCKELQRRDGPVEVEASGRSGPGSGRAAAGRLAPGDPAHAGPVP